MLAHGCAGDFRGAGGMCRIYIAQGGGGSARDLNTAGCRDGDRLQFFWVQASMPPSGHPAWARIPAALGESAIIGMRAAGPLASLFTHEHCRFATDHGPAAGIPS
jgi:hypothetical protein